MNNRQKGLHRVREVKKMLEGLGHVCEGPGYSIAFFDGQMRPIHRDYFGVGDLISYHEGQFILHQVTDLSHKSKHLKAIQNKGLIAWLWCKIDQHRIGYRIFKVSQNSIEETEAVFKT